jgi:hypothetical protein
MTVQIQSSATALNLEGHYFWIFLGKDYGVIFHYAWENLELQLVFQDFRGDIKQRHD